MEAKKGKKCFFIGWRRREIHVCSFRQNSITDCFQLGRCRKNSPFMRYENHLRKHFLAESFFPHSSHEGRFPLTLELFATFDCSDGCELCWLLYFLLLKYCYSRFESLEAKWEKKEHPCDRIKVVIHFFFDYLRWKDIRCNLSYLLKKRDENIGASI